MAPTAAGCRHQHRRVSTSHWVITRAAIPFFQRALEISTRLRDDFWTAKELNNLAEVNISLGDLSTAERYNNQALAMQKARNDPEALIYPILNAARIESARGNTAQASKLYQDAAELKTKDPASRWSIYAGLADLAFRGGDVTRARTEVAKAVNVIDASWSQLSNDQSKLTFPAPRDALLPAIRGLPGLGEPWRGGAGLRGIAARPPAGRKDGCRALVDCRAGTSAGWRNRNTPSSSPTGSARSAPTCGRPRRTASAPSRCLASRKFARWSIAIRTPSRIHARPISSRTPPRVNCIRPSSLPCTTCCLKARA